MRFPVNHDVAILPNGDEREIRRSVQAHLDEIAWMWDGDIVYIRAEEQPTLSQLQTLDEKVNAQIHDEPSTWFNLYSSTEDDRSFSMTLRDVQPGSQVSGALQVLVASTEQPQIMDGEDTSDWDMPTRHSYWQWWADHGGVNGLRGDLIHFPTPDLLADVESLRAEQKWLKAMTTKGAWVVVEGAVDEPDIIGRIVKPTADPMGGDREVLVEHEMFERTSQGKLVRVDGPTVQRWYSVFRLAPYQAPGRVLKMPGVKGLAGFKPGDLVRAKLVVGAPDSERNRGTMDGVVVKVTPVRYGSGGTRAKVRVQWASGSEAVHDDRQLTHHPWKP